MLAPDERSDAELLEAMCAGDERAFTTVYRRHQGSVYRFAAHMCGSAATAEDVTQEVFIVLMKQASRFDSARGTLRAFLLGVARNHVLRTFANDKSFAASESEIEDVCFSADDPFEKLARDEAVATLRRAISSLPAHFREALVLCELQELSYEEAAEVIGCATGTVRSRLHRARQLLGTKMRDANAEAPHAFFSTECLI